MAQYSRDDFRSAFKGQPLFVDPTGKVNLAAGIDISTLEMVRLLDPLLLHRFH